MTSTFGYNFRCVFHLSVFAAGITFFAFALPVQAEDVSPTLKPKSDLQQPQQAKTQTTGWSLMCRVNATTTARICELSNSIYVNDGKQRFLALSFTPDGGDDKGLTVQVILPHGVDFAAGVSLQWGKSKPVVLKPFTTDSTGIFVQASLSQEQFEGMQGAEEVVVKFKGFGGDVFSAAFKISGVVSLISNPRDLMK